MDEDGRLDIFDLLLGVLADQVEMGEVHRPNSDPYVSKIYSDLLQEASSPQSSPILLVSNCKTASMGGRFRL